MSAFVVSKAHIDAIISVARLGPAEADRSGVHWWPLAYADGTTRRFVDVEPDAAGAILLLENERSVAHRYSRPFEPEGSGAACYTFACPTRRPTAVEALKLIACLDYQSCEHPGWRDSEAFAFCAALKDALISVLPGYGTAPWEWPS